MVRQRILNLKLMGLLLIATTASMLQAAVVLSWSAGELTVTIDDPIEFTTILPGDLLTFDLQVVLKDVYNSSQANNSPVTQTIDTPLLQTPSSGSPANGSFRTYDSVSGDVVATDLVLNFNFGASQVTIQNNETITLTAGTSYNQSFLGFVAEPDNLNPSVFYLADSSGEYISAAVPEASSTILFVSGLVGLAVVLRRRLK